MKGNGTKLFIKHLAAILVCGAVAWMYISAREFTSAPRLEQYRMLSDAFLIPGLVTVLIGCLFVISNKGGLDGVSFAVGRAVRMLIPGAKKKDEKYLDYVEHKRSNPLRGFGFLFSVGGTFCVISIVFMILFYQLRG
ncbi:MAG: DUF3899 domain-containing protein [Acetatifactor sp.]|nr:DUF3899 domain-containing protein [Acetatifactor sp.]